MIYRKVITGLSASVGTAGDWETVTTLANVSKLVNCTLYTSSGIINPTGVTYTSGTIKVLMPLNNFTITSAVVEYTKA